jgi:hypothetical protein
MSLSRGDFFGKFLEILGNFEIEGTRIVLWGEVKGSPLVCCWIKKIEHMISWTSGIALCLGKPY